VVLLFGYPVAFSLAANGLFFGWVGIEMGLLQPALLQALVAVRLAQPSCYVMLQSYANVVPRPGYTPNGEDRAWGRRLLRDHSDASGGPPVRTMSVGRILSTFMLAARRVIVASIT
jgi:hypothetical protein